MLSRITDAFYEKANQYLANHPDFPDVPAIQLYEGDMEPLQVETSELPIAFYGIGELVRNDTISKTVTMEGWSYTVLLSIVVARNETETLIMVSSGIIDLIMAFVRGNRVLDLIGSTEYAVHTTTLTKVEGMKHSVERQLLEFSIQIDFVKRRQNE